MKLDRNGFRSPNSIVLARPSSPWDMNWKLSRNRISLYIGFLTPCFVVYSDVWISILKDIKVSPVRPIDERISLGRNWRYFRMWCASYLARMWKKTGKKLTVFAFNLHFEWGSPYTSPVAWLWWMTASLSISLLHKQHFFALDRRSCSRSFVPKTFFRSRYFWFYPSQIFNHLLRQSTSLLILFSPRWKDSLTTLFDRESTITAL